MDNSRYIDRKYIGAGGMASVYKAFDRTLERHVAIKEMAGHMRQNADVRKLFLDEARKMAAIRDRNVVQVYDVFEQDGVPTIVMELMEGGSVSSRLGPGSLPVDEVLDILEQVASGLRAIHNVGVIHRDVKPENIIEDNGVYKITDFGVAMSGEEDTLPFVTSKYAAPEVLLEPDRIDRTSDLYSLGMMAIELLLGTRRFEEVVREAIESERSVELPAVQDSAQAFWQQWVASPTELPMLNQLDDAIPADVASLIGRLVRRERDARIADCDSLLEELVELRRQVRQRSGAETLHDPKLARKLQKIRDQRERADSAPESTATPEPKRKRPSALRLAGGLAGVVVVAFVALLFWPTGAAVRVDIVTEPPGATVTHNGQRYEGYPTPTWVDATWGDTLALELDGQAPVEVVLAEDMGGLVPTDEGYRLDVAFSGPLVIGTSEAAAGLIREWLADAPTPDVALRGASRDDDGGYTVTIGTDLVFDVGAGRPGTLTMIHLGADDAVSLIYPDPTGTVIGVEAEDAVAVGGEIGLVTSEPAGREWFLFLIAESPWLPPDIEGMQQIGGWARRYPLGEADAPGQAFVLSLLGTPADAGLAGVLVPVEIVR